MRRVCSFVFDTLCKALPSFPLHHSLLYQNSNILSIDFFEIFTIFSIFLIFYFTRYMKLSHIYAILSHTTQTYDIFNFRSNLLRFTNTFQSTAQSTFGRKEFGKHRAHHAILGSSHQRFKAVDVAAAFPKSCQSRGSLLV